MRKSSQFRFAKRLFIFIEDLKRRANLTLDEFKSQENRLNVSFYSMETVAHKKQTQQQQMVYNRKPSEESLNKNSHSQHSLCRIAPLLNQWKFENSLNDNSQQQQQEFLTRCLVSLPGIFAR